MNEVKLNLARRWRSKNFDEIVGQDLSVRILKNSLYKGQFFPVYLLSGQRGCGKTTTARVLAAAINCSALSSFQLSPQHHSLPCLVCPSCTAMRNGNHPDFIEIDAASHTGVDNVRTIIEAASYMPLMGRKKIYLIDEAHMLSKAAFNALLKVLEEPPLSALFMLATTDPHKIVDTVRSRCFQLFFRPVDQTALVSHLAAVCDAEQVAYEIEGLALVAAQSEGSVRDALNLIEQVRFTTKGVTPTAVLSVLGRLDDGVLISIVQTALCAGPGDLLKLLKKHRVETYSAEYVWQRLCDLARALLWAKHGVDAELFSGYNDALQRCASASSILQINKLLQALYDHELAFTKTTSKYAIIELVLLYISGFASSGDNSGGTPSTSQQAVAFEICESESEETVSDEDDEDEQEDEEDTDAPDYARTWNHCIKQLEKDIDPFVASMLSQSFFIGYDHITHVLRIELPKNLMFFEDKLQNKNAAWYRVLQDAFSASLQLSLQFTADSKQPVSTIKKTEPLVSTVPSAQATTVVKPAVSTSAHPQKISSTQSSSTQSKNLGAQNTRFAKSPYQQKRVQKSYGSVVDVSDVATWQKANLLLQYFPGTVYEIME